MEGKVKRAGLYPRVSTEEQAKEGTSIDSQLAKLRTHAQLHDWQVVGEYVDAGYSGRTDDRPELQRVIKDAEAGRLDVVAVWKMDRFFRKLKLLLEYKERLDKAGVAFVSVSEGIDTSTPMGRLLFNLLGSIHEWEREEIVSRTKAGRQTRYARGEWASGQPLYGYQYDPITKKLKVREDEAPTVRRIFSLYVHDRLGFAQIGRLLNAEGVRPRQQASRWHSSAIRNVIAHPGYKGDHPVKIECPPIIEPALWEMAQKRRRDNAHLHRRDGDPWLLQAMVKCGLCGRLLKAEWSHGANGRRVYSCYGRRQDTFPDSDHKCSLPRIPADWLEDQVWQRIADALSNPDSLRRTLEEYIASLEARKAALETAIRPVEEKLAGVNKELAKLAVAWVKDALGGEEVERRKAELEAERERLLSLRAQVDPAQIEELQSVQGWLEFWDSTHKDLNFALQFVLGGETPEEREAEKAEKRDIIRHGYRGVWEVADIESPSLSKELGVPTSRRQLLDYLQTELWGYPDRVEIRAAIPVDAIRLPVNQECNSVCR